MVRPYEAYDQGIVNRDVTGKPGPPGQQRVVFTTTQRPAKGGLGILAFGGSAHTRLTVPHHLPQTGAEPCDTRVSGTL